MISHLLRPVRPPQTCGRYVAVALAASCLLFPAALLAQARSGTAPAKATDSAKDEEAIQLSTFVVTEEQDIGYESMQTTSGMRTVQSLKNVANSISIMNSQLIEDLGLTTMEDMATWFVSGESNPDTNATVSSRVILRGVPNAYAMRNGWIWYSPMDSYSTERVELLRGPNAFLYGEADLGGGQNQLTKRGLFTRTITRTKLMVGSWDMRRGELDLNRILVKDKLAVRLAAVQHNNRSWIDSVRREYRGLYGAITYRPWRNTTISLMGEHAKSTAVNSQGLFSDAFSRVATANVAASAGYIYIPKTGAMFRSAGTGRVISTGPGVAVVDTSILPKSFQSNGPNSTYKDYYDTLTLDAETRLFRNLLVQISGNLNWRHLDSWAASGKVITRDRSPLLPNGTPNPYFNELYTEYYRQHNIGGNLVRDMRLSAIYDFNVSWMKQQLALNLQQHQDTPGQKSPKFGEYVDPTSPNFLGTINPAVTQAAFTANRTTFTNNRLMRRYYLKDGVKGNEDLGPIPGVSAWYPDMSSLVPATGNFIQRRFYTPSVGVGASGSYFHDHLFTMFGYRQDHFNMKTTLGAVQPIAQTWVNEFIPGAFAPNPAFVHYKVDGKNAGGVLRLNDTFAVAYNHAQSFRISIGEGAATFNSGELLSIPRGQGDEYSARLSLFKGRLEINTVYYKSFQPNGRYTGISLTQAQKDELSAIFPTTFNTAASADYQTTTTKGTEFEAVANLTRSWALTFNVGTNKVTNVNRAPILKSFQTAAKAMNKATPLLDDFLLTIPEGLPNPGYTKARANIFTRYQFNEGVLKGFYVGAGANWRRPTYRGTSDLDGIASTPTVDLWSPSYTICNLLAGYRAKIMQRPTTFALNIDNLTDKEYYRSAALGTGSWGDPRSFKLTIITEF